MARQNNIPQFDSSDTNISNVPTNGFSANTTIYSGQVNGAIRWTSFAITALLNAIASNTTETGSYEYTKNGATGVDTLSGQISTDLKNIVKKYTFDTGGTFGKQVTFTYDTIFKGASSTANAPSLCFVSPTTSNHHRNVYVTAYSAYTDNDFTLKISCEDWAGQAVSEYFGKFYLKKKITTDNSDTIVTFANGEYTLYPYYTHHIRVETTPNSGNVKYVSMYLTMTLPVNMELTTINQISNFADRSTYVASGFVNINNERWCPIYLFDNARGLTAPTVYYLDSGQNLFALSSSQTYTITDDVTKYE